MKNGAPGPSFGNEIWKSSQTHPLFGIYKYPGIASTPLIMGGRVIFREMNSHGGNEGQARNLVYLDKATGNTLARRFAGHVDYRTRLAPVAGNGGVVVYPYGKHDIYGSPAVCQNFNRLIWKYKADDWIRSRPYVTGQQLWFATISGRVYSIDHEGRIISDMKISDHAIYADLAGRNDTVLITDSNRWQRCFRHSLWISIFSEC